MYNRIKNLLIFYKMLINIINCYYKLVLTGFINNLIFVYLLNNNFYYNNCLYNQVGTNFNKFFNTIYL